MNGSILFGGGGVGVSGKGEREGEKAGQYLQEETRLIARSLHRDGQRHAKSHPGHEHVLYGLRQQAGRENEEEQAQQPTEQRGSPPQETTICMSLKVSIIMSSSSSSSSSSGGNTRKGDESKAEDIKAKQRKNQSHTWLWPHPPSSPTPS